MFHHVKMCTHSRHQPIIFVNPNTEVMGNLKIKCFLVLQSFYVSRIYLVKDISFQNIANLVSYMYSEVSKEKLRGSFVKDIADNRAFSFLYKL